MNGENNNPIFEQKEQSSATQPKESFLGLIAVGTTQEPVSDNPLERVKRAGALVAEIRAISEDDLSFHELIIQGISSRLDDNEPDIKLVWGGRPFPLYEHNRIVTYIDAYGEQKSVLVTIEAMGSYALRADELPHTNGDPYKEQVKLRKFKKKIQQKGLWGIHVSLAEIKDTLDPAHDKVVYSSDGTREYIADAQNQELYTISLRNSDNQSVLRAIDAEDLAQLQLITDIVKTSSIA